MLYFSKFETSNMICYWGFEQEVVIGEGFAQEVVVIHLHKKQMIAKPRKNSISRQNGNMKTINQISPPFTNQHKLNVDVPENADMIDFWDILYASQFREKEEQEYIKKLGKSVAVVPKAMRNLYGKGYHLYVDNWYTS